VMIGLLVALGLPLQAQILIGQTAGFTGRVAGGVKESSDGAKLYLDMVNARGGVHGQKVELVSLDDGLDPKQAVVNARRLIVELGVTALFLTRSTPVNEALLPVVEQYGVPLVAPSTGAMSLHKPVRKWVFNVRAPYQREVEKLIKHLVTLGLERIAVVASDDSFGADCLVGVQRGFESVKLQPAVLERFNSGRPDYDAIASKVQQAQAQAILLIARSQTVVESHEVMRKQGIRAQIATLSNNASLDFIRQLGEYGRGIVVSQVFPGVRETQYPLVREVEAQAKLRGQELSPSMLEGWVAAKLLVEGLRRAGANPTRDRLRASLESIQRFDMGGQGLEISYSPDNHTGLEFTDLSIISTDGSFVR